MWNKELDAIVGERLRLERKRLGKTAIDVYRALNISQKTYKSYESGVKGVPVSVAALLKDMGFDLNYIITGELRASKPVTLVDGNYKLLVIGVVANGSNVMSESIFRVSSGQVELIGVDTISYDAVKALDYLKYFIITAIQTIYEQRRQHQRAFNEYSQKIMITTFNEMLESVLLASTVDELCHGNTGGIKVVVERYTAASADKDLYKIFW